MILSFCDSRLLKKPTELLRLGQGHMGLLPTFHFYVQEALDMKLKSSTFADTLLAGRLVSDLAVKYPPGDAARPPPSRAPPTWVQQSDAGGLPRVLLFSGYF